VPCEPDPIRLEAVMQGVAEGLSKAAAGRRAGHSAKTTSYYPVLKREACVERIALLKRCRALSRDGLAPTILALIDAAKAAPHEGAATAWNAVARMLTEAGRLQMGLPPASEDDDGPPDWAAPD